MISKYVEVYTNTHISGVTVTLIKLVENRLDLFEQILINMYRLVNHVCDNVHQLDLC